MDAKDPSSRQDRAPHLVGRVAVPAEGEAVVARPDEGEALLGQLIGNYRVVAKLAQGGMGTVYEAVHQQIGRRAAIKVLGAELSRDEENASRFLNEARAVNLVKHHGLVQIFEFGQIPDGTTYIVMEYLEGESLGARIERAGGRLGADALRLTRQIATSLLAAHQRGVVHRDLKPSNVMIVPDSEAPGGERTKILDFGIAKVLRVPERDREAAPGFQTGTGVVLGTPVYMAPEQCRASGGVDDKVDVYSLGIMLYQMLCGQPPFMAKEPVEIMAMHLCMVPRPLRDRDPTISEDVAKLVGSMLSKSAADRPTMGQVAAELERLERPPPKPTPSLETLEQFFNERELRDPAPPVPKTQAWQPWLLGATFVMGLCTTALGVWVWAGAHRAEPEAARQPIGGRRTTAAPVAAIGPAPVIPAPVIPAPVIPAPVLRVPAAPAAPAAPAPAPTRPAPPRGVGARGVGTPSVTAPTRPVVKSDEDIKIFEFK